MGLGAAVYWVGQGSPAPHPGRNEGSPHPKPRSHPMGEGGGGLSAPLERGEQAKHWRHSRELGAREVQAFLTYLAAATQNQALNALVFFYKLRLKKQIPAR